MPAKPSFDVPAPPTNAKPSLQARKQELVRETLWTAAIDLFTRQGFEETTVDDVVASAGTSRRTFFRHFESKRDLMSHPVLTYGASLTQAIESSPAQSTPAELFRHVVLQVARRTVSDSRTRQVMEIAAKYPAAREAQLSRIAEVQDRVAQAFAGRTNDEFTAHVLAGLTLSALSLAYRAWFAQGKKDINAAVEQVFAKFAAVLAE